MSLSGRERTPLWQWATPRKIGYVHGPVRDIFEKDCGIQKYRYHYTMTVGRCDNGGADTRPSTKEGIEAHRESARQSVNSVGSRDLKTSTAGISNKSEVSLRPGY